MNHFRKVSALSAAIATLFGAYSAPVLSQEGAGLIEEIVVTARRREENLQEVPIAISALNTEDIELRNIGNTENLNVLIPNVDIRGGSTSSSSNFTVRGIPGVARYMDGVVMSGGIGGLESIVELERVEVLRGPQGTYFGKNAIGGAIQYVTQKPQDEFGARIKARFGSFNRSDITANVDIPLSDTVKTKVTAAQISRDGYVDSVTVAESYGEEDTQIVRGQLQWEPSENFTALFTAQVARTDQNMQASVLWDAVDQEDRPINPNNGRPYGRNLPSEYQAIGLDFTDENYAFGLRDEWKTGSNYQGPANILDIDSLTADFLWDINDSLTLRVLLNEREFQRGTMFDRDGTPWHAFEDWLYNVQEENSQEFQLLGTGDRFNWVVGLYLDEVDVDNLRIFWQAYEVRERGVPPLLSRRVAEDAALFAEISYDLTEALTLTVGARSSEEDFHSETFRALYPKGDPQTPQFDLQNREIRLVQGVPVIQDAKFDAVTPRVALQYQFTDTIMGYVSYAEGFNGGGVNSRFDPTLPNNGILAFNDELLGNVEIGIRSDLLDGRLRLNATYFDGTWEDIQIGEVLTPGTTTTTNAGEAAISGLEVEATLRTGGPFSMNFAFGLLDTAYTDVGLATTTLALDSSFPYAPDTSYSVGFQWDNDLSSGASLLTRFDYGWIDDHETFRDKRFHFSRNGGKAYGLLSARLQYTAASGAWSAALYGTNLTNEYYREGGFNAILAGVDQGYVGRPREVGLQLTMDFD